MQGLSSFFLVAGANSLIVSLWSVADKAPASSCKRFTNWLTKMA
ncbi:MAG: CHAT domain-containing protein [Saprospiraceae bacterium]|nr:CHAT domain-containing protein [Saprospiraceae bacterium]